MNDLDIAVASAKELDNYLYSGDIAHWAVVMDRIATLRRDIFIAKVKTWARCQQCCSTAEGAAVMRKHGVRLRKYKGGWYVLGMRMCKPARAK
jgi:hypothetical protein